MLATLSLRTAFPQKHCHSVMHTAVIKRFVTVTFNMLHAIAAIVQAVCVLAGCILVLLTPVLYCQEHCSNSTHMTKTM